MKQYTDKKWIIEHLWRNSWYNAYHNYIQTGWEISILPQTNRNDSKETNGCFPMLIFPSLFGWSCMYLKFCDSYFDTSRTVYFSTYFSLIISTGVGGRDQTTEEQYRIPTGYHSNGVKNV